jgi:two-component system phosphate regulon response regulator PhoB/two-component system alkaline phosphatase synthesis response regulator PhoP
MLNNDEIKGMNKPVVAVVDDEPDILELVSIHLEKNGFIALGFNDANELFKLLEKKNPDLIILDLMLPDIDGFEVCKFLRSRQEYKDIPIIMLTARSEEADKVTGLEIGADDYITKPFSPREMIARVKAVLRRGAKHKEDIIHINNDFYINIAKYEVVFDGETVRLTTSEFKILQQIASRPGWVFSREQILNNLGVNEKGVIDRTVDVHIKNIREKLGEAGKFIKNVRGVGYKLEV